MPLFNRKKPVDTTKPVSAPSSPARKPSTSTLLSNGSLTSSFSQLPYVDVATHPRTNASRLQEDLFQRWEEDSSFLFVTPLRTRSRLSESFNDVLHDHAAIVFFIQFMDSRDATALVKFWLDVESFNASAKMRIQSHDLAVASSATEHKKQFAKSSNNRPHSESESNSVNCHKKDVAAVDPSVAPVTSATSQHRLESFRGRRDSGSGDSVASKDDLKASASSHTVQDACWLSAESRSQSDATCLPTTGCTTANDDSRETVNCCDKGVSPSDVSQAKRGSLKRQTKAAVGGRESDSLRVDSTICDKLKKSIADDAVKIFTKYIAKDATLPIGVTNEMRDEITAKICLEDGQVDPTCFDSAQHFVHDVMQKDYFPDYAISDYQRKFQIDVLTSGKIQLEDILYNESALSAFMEYLEQEGKRPLLEFWLTADNFRQHLGSLKTKYDAAEVQEDAMVLYDKYFSLQATCSLGFGNGVRFEVEQNICREEGPLLDCFEKPVKMVFHFLQKNYLKPFLTSQLYFSYLSELLNTSRTANSDFYGTKKRSGSDSGSEHSISTQNTLLAGTDSVQPGAPARKILCNIEQDMNIHMDFHPDSLWKRDMAGKLTFGHVTSLGQFIPELEPEPDKKKHTESVLSKAMKRLVNKEEDKVKEDMAWQVAAMIVKEVTSITCGTQDVQRTHSS